MSRSSRPPWADERGLRDQALVEGAVADAVPADTKIAEVADLQYEGDAHAAALDLSLADGRFAPDVLEVAARRAVTGWARAIDGDDRALRRGRHPGGDPRAALRRRHQRPHPRGRPRAGRQPHPGRRAWMPRAEPPTMTIEVDLIGRRYIENRDTAGGAGRQPHPQDELHRALDAQPHRRSDAAVADHRRWPRPSVGLTPRSGLTARCCGSCCWCSRSCSPA